MPWSSRTGQPHLCILQYNYPYGNSRGYLKNIFHQSDKDIINVCKYTQQDARKSLIMAKFVSSKGIASFNQNSMEYDPW